MAARVLRRIDRVVAAVLGITGLSAAAGGAQGASGTVLALEYALRFPTHVSHLILMNPAPASTDDFALLRKMYAEKQGPGDMERQKAIMAGAHAFLLEQR